MVRADINAPLTLRVRAGELGATAKQSPMPRTATTIGERDLERALLRRGVDAASGELDRCADCGRTPLIGETLYRYAANATVCELCRPLRREVPEGSELVRNSECADTVRVHRLSRS
jgi:hypothetical protein